MWSQSLKVDYVPMIDIRTVKETGKGLRGAVLETANIQLNRLSSM